MAKKNTNKLLIIFGIILAIFIFRQGGQFTGAFTGNEVLTVTGPNEVAPNDPVTITFTATGVDPAGNWVAVGNTISFSGGCKFSNGQSQITDFFMFPSDNPKMMQITTPNTDATCRLTGSYFFGDSGDISLTPYTLNVVSCQPNCNRPSDLCIEASAHSDGCGGNCAGQWTVNKNTEADSNCNGQVTKSELIQAILAWVDNQISKTQLIQAILAWAGGN